MQHPKERKKLCKKRLAQSNSAALKALFMIDPKDYVDKPLVIDMSTTSEDDIYD